MKQKRPVKEQAKEPEAFSVWVARMLGWTEMIPFYWPPKTGRFEGWCPKDAKPDRTKYPRGGSYPAFIPHENETHFLSADENEPASFGIHWSDGKHGPMYFFGPASSIEDDFFVHQWALAQRPGDIAYLCRLSQKLNERLGREALPLDVFANYEVGDYSRAALEVFEGLAQKKAGKRNAKRK